jgi:hypothetical protein
VTWKAKHGWQMWCGRARGIKTLSKATYCKGFASRKCDCEIPVPGWVNVFTSLAMPFQIVYVK